MVNRSNRVTDCSLIAVDCNRLESESLSPRFCRRPARLERATLRFEACSLATSDCKLLHQSVVSQPNSSNPDVNGCWGPTRSQRLMVGRQLQSRLQFREKTDHQVDLRFPPQRAMRRTRLPDGPIVVPIAVALRRPVRGRKRRREWCLTMTGRPRPASLSGTIQGGAARRLGRPP